MLAKLIYPTPSSDFLDAIFTRRAQGFTPGLDRMSPWLRELAGHSLTQIAEVPCTRLVVMYNDAGGLLHTLPAEPRHALRLYQDHGCTICMSEVDLSELPSGSGVRRDLNELGHALGVRASDVQINLYASPPGGGLAAHWDHTDSFIVQLCGSKRWRVAENREFPHPRFNYVPGVFAPNEVWAAHVDGPPRMPDAADIVDLEPGATLHVPRGFWHETHAGSESLSIAIKIRPTTWGELIARYLEAELHDSPHWRELAMGIFGDQALRERARVRLEELMTELFARWAERPPTPHDIMRAVNPESGLVEPVSPGDVLARNSAVRLELRPNPKAEAGEVIIGLPTGARTALTLNEALAGVCRRVATSREPTPAARLIGSDGASVADGLKLLTVLVETGALSRIAKAPRDEAP
jgi:hypothetical protein